jgi:hypothetical protein
MKRNNSAIVNGDHSFEELYLKFDSVIADIYSITSDIFEQLDSLEKDAVTIKDQPHFIGSPIFSRNKYLVLVPPMVDGERKHHYIGNNPSKISDAMAKIERGKLLRNINEQIDNKHYQLLIILTQLEAIRNKHLENTNDE